MNFFKKKTVKPRKTDVITLYKYFCMFKTVDGKEHRYDMDIWSYKDIDNIPFWCMENGYIKDNFDNVYPMTSILSFSWDWWDKIELEYYMDEVNFFIPDFLHEKYIEKIRVKGSDINR